MIRGYYTWRDNRTIQQIYRTHGPRAVARLLGRSPQGVYLKARQLGVVKRRPPKWTKAEDEFVRTHYASEGPEWVAEQIGRSVSAVQVRMSRITNRRRGTDVLRHPVR